MVYVLKKLNNSDKTKLFQNKNYEFLEFNFNCKENFSINTKLNLSIILKGKKCSKFNNFK